MVGDVQRKITPWNSSTTEILNELFPIFPVSSQKAEKSQLILVSSLVHKAPNIGGKYSLHILVLMCRNQLLQSSSLIMTLLITATRL